MEISWNYKSQSGTLFFFKPSTYNSIRHVAITNGSIAPSSEIDFPIQTVLE